MIGEPKLLEKEAHTFFSEEKFLEAFGLFKKAAQGYREAGLHKQAALCFASAATCWSKKSGEKIFYNAAKTYEEAASETFKSGDLEYASILYRYAAINYERDREFINFSDCFYYSKEAYRKFLTYRLFLPNKINPIVASKEKEGVRGFIKRLFLWILLTVSFVTWGHGERPLRTFFTGTIIVVLCALGYTYGFLTEGSVAFRPSYFEAFYFSIVTFTTLGYGDIAPIGAARSLAAAEAFSGIFIMPLFLIGLSRKYLRI